MSGNDGTTESVELPETVTFDSAFASALNPEPVVEDTATEATEPIEGEGTDLPETEVEGEAGTESTEEAPVVSDEDEDRYVAVINGEEIEVTLSELVNGYQRQRDYTQKTQALAEEREQLAAYQTLAEQLADNPQAVIAALADRFGVALGSPPAPAENEYALDPTDPIERELIELRNFKAEMAEKLSTIEQERTAQSASQRQAEVFGEIDRIKATNSDPDLDPNDLLQFAVDHRIGDLDMAYVAMRATKPKTVPPTIRKIEAKRAQPPVEGGGHRAGVVNGSPDARMTLEEALAAALSEH